MSVTRSGADETTTGTLDTSLPSDGDLLSAVRAGNRDAYGLLFTRYRGLALQRARRWAQPPTHEDLVSEAFRAVLEAIVGGCGPDSDGFVPYLMTAIVRTAHKWHRRDSGTRLCGNLDVLDSAEPFIDPAVARFESALITRAYASLDSTQRAVLWHTVIDGKRPRHAAPALGLSAEQTRDAARRARYKLATAYARQLGLAQC